MKWVKWGGLALLVFIVATIYVKRGDSGSQTALRNVAAEINRKAPWAVGPGIQMDKASFVGKQFDIYYTITDMKASDVPSDAAKTEFKKLMVKIVCENEAMRRAVKNDIVFASIWKGSDGQQITHVRVAAADCV